MLEINRNPEFDAVAEYICKEKVILRVINPFFIADEDDTVEIDGTEYLVHSIKFQPITEKHTIYLKLLY